MSLLTYAEARPWAKAIREAVATGKMPPWFADKSVGHFTNDKSLTAKERETLLAWVNQGAIPKTRRRRVNARRDGRLGSRTRC